ncbi:response regulator [Myxococcota bacterium]|nr:response regulator [Myxococcota bacterium]
MENRSNPPTALDVAIRKLEETGDVEALSREETLDVAPPRAEPPSRPTILVVDDVPENVAVLGGLLQDDYRVLVATAGARAIEIVEGRSPPDLVLLDVMMPDMNGYDVLRRLKEGPRSDVPVIFCTSLDDVDDQHYGLELGAIDYLTKPIEPAIVRVRVKNHLELARARQALARQNDALEAEVRRRTEALSISNEALKESSLQMIDLAFGVLSQADAFLGDHCRRVAATAVRLGLHVGLDDEALFDLRVAALLHDLALIGQGSSELEQVYGTASPRSDVRFFEHAIAHRRVLAASRRFARTSAIIEGHHEDLDGGGFPAGARGDTISLGSRILAVADRWDLFLQQPADGGPRTFESFAALWRGKLDAELVRALGTLLERPETMLDQS